MTDGDKIPSSWEMVKLGEICSTTSGGTPSRSQKKYYSGNIPWVKSGELDKGVIIDTEEKITQEAVNNSSTKIFPKGTLLIALYGATIGKLAFLGINAATNQAVCGILKNENVDSKYLYHFLFFSKPALVKRSIGGAQPNISQGILKDLDIPLPPLPEQHRIVEKIEALFSELDNGIEQLTTAQQQLKVYRQAVLKWAFEGKLTRQNQNSQNDRINRIDKEEKQFGKFSNPVNSDSDNLRTAEELLERIRQEREQQAKASGKKLKPIAPLTEKEVAELPELPKGWGWVKVSLLGEVETGSTPSKQNPKFYSNDFPFYKPTDLEAGYNVRVASDNLSKLGMQEARFLPENSILVTCIGATIGKTGIIRRPGASNQQINSIIPSRVLDPNFVYYQVIAPEFQKQIKDNASATTLPILNKSKFENLTACVCSADEQHQIVQEIESRLSVCDKLEETITASLQQSEALRQSILKKVFEGKLVEQDPHDETAGVLLERIAADKTKNGKPSYV